MQTEAGEATALRRPWRVRPRAQVMTSMQIRQEQQAVRQKTGSELKVKLIQLRPPLGVQVLRSGGPGPQSLLGNQRAHMICLNGAVGMTDSGDGL